VTSEPSDTENGERRALPDDDPLAGMEEAFGQAIPDPRMREMVKAAFRAFASAPENAGGRAFLDAARSMTPEELARLKSPQFREEYRERLARFYEEASDAELMRIPTAAGFGTVTNNPALRTLVTRTSRKRVAGKIRELEIEGTRSGREVARLLRGKPLSPLSDPEKAGMARMLRFSGPRIVEAEDEARAGNLAAAAERFSEGILAAPALMLRPPPRGELYGRKRRSEILLPTDRRPCDWVGCQRRCTNNSHFCSEHSTAAKRDKDAKKKARRHSQIALAKEQARAAPGAFGPAVNPDGTMSGEMEPGPDLRTVRRKLQEIR
jgi:hypothetical protein